MVDFDWTVTGVPYFEINCERKGSCAVKTQNTRETDQIAAHGGAELGRLQCNFGKIRCGRSPCGPVYGTWSNQWRSATSPSSTLPFTLPWAAQGDYGREADMPARAAPWGHGWGEVPRAGTGGGVGLERRWCEAGAAVV